jgi:phosphoglycolate phosphatase
MPCIRAALFDLDGTLVDSAQDLTDAVNAVLTKRGLATFDTATVSSFLGKGAIHLMREVALARGLPASDEDIARLVVEYADVLVASGSRGTQFFPGAVESLKQLRESGVKVGLVTNKMRAITIAFLEKRDAFCLFDTIVAADDTEHPKPAADMLLLAMKQLDAAPQETVMIGDSRNDALAGRAAGTRVLLVNTGYNEGEPIDLWAERNGFAKSLDGIASVARLVLAENSCH